MSSHSGPRVENTGLALLVDPGNIKTNPKLVYNNNLLNYTTWTEGSGSVGIFTMNGTAAENTRVYDTDPFGHLSIVWQSPSNDVTSDADGGWDTSNFAVDPTKTYRFSVWIRRKVLGNGSVYLGCYGKNSSGTNIGVIRRDNGTTDTNPYFIASSWPLNTNQWYLFVGHVWPVGSGTGSAHTNSGIYTTAGVKVATVSDFVWNTGTTLGNHRTYLYYSTDTTTSQQWSHPKVELCDGKEIPISGLIANQSNTIVNPYNPTLSAIVKNQIPLSSSNALTFNNDTHYMALSNSLNYTNDVSVFAWVKIAGTPKGGLHSICGGQELEISIPTAGQLRTGVLTSGGRYYNDLGSGLADGRWHHVGFTYSGTTKTTYIDGEPVGSQTTTGTLVSTFANRAIGRFGADTTYALNGELSGFKVFTLALTSTQVKQNFNGQRGRFGR